MVSTLVYTFYPPSVHFLMPHRENERGPAVVRLCEGTEARSPAAALFGGFKLLRRRLTLWLYHFLSTDRENGLKQWGLMKDLIEQEVFVFQTFRLAHSLDVFILSPV